MRPSISACCPKTSAPTRRTATSAAWNREALTAREPEFKDIVAAHYGDQIATDYAGSVDALKTRLGTLDQELADLRLPADQRAATMSEIETAADKLDAANGDHIDRVTRMNELRRQARSRTGRQPAAARDAFRSPPWPQRAAR
jgi:hypothetical protein